MADQSGFNPNANGLDSLFAQLRSQNPQRSPVAAPSYGSQAAFASGHGFQPASSLSSVMPPPSHGAQPHRESSVASPGAAAHIPTPAAHQPGSDRTTNLLNLLKF